MGACGQACVDLRGGRELHASRGNDMWWFNIHAGPEGSLPHDKPLLGTGALVHPEARPRAPLQTP